MARKKKTVEEATGDECANSAEPIERSGHVATKIFGRELTVTLTEHERAERGRELADLMIDVNGQREAAKEQIRDLRKKLKLLDDDINDLSRIVANGRETRLVECQRIVDFDKGIVKEVRLDTGETLNVRELKPEEQPTLPGTDTPGESSPAGEAAAEPEEASPLGTVGMIWPAGGAKGEDKAPVAASDADALAGLILAAVEILRSTRRASLSTLQRRLRIPFTSADRLMSELEARGIVGPATPDGAPREIIELPVEPVAEQSQDKTEGDA